MYPALGYDRYYNELDYKITPETKLNWGLKDIEYFDQSIDMLKQIEATILYSLPYFNESLPIHLR